MKTQTVFKLRCPYRSIIRRQCDETYIVILHPNPPFLLFFTLSTGRDCIGCAKTGSGKTAAFALPILQKLCEDPYGIFALVLSPTRYNLLPV